MENKYTKTLENIEKKYVKDIVIEAFIFMIGIIVMGFVFIGEKDRLNKKLQDKQEIIESQAELLIEKDNEIESCEWYKNYYYDSVCEDCEVRE